LSHLREIGKEALCWQLSSAKPGNGVEQIRDASLDTYWQSDGTKQPHWIQVHFARRVAVSHVCLYLDYSLDESYTPKKVGVQHGMTNQDLQAAVHPSNTQIEFNEPVGWCIVPLSWGFLSRSSHWR
jgi:anaphase-promoting complex subunit 10